MTSATPESRDGSPGFGFDLPPDVATSPTGDYFFRVGELLVAEDDLPRNGGLEEFLGRIGTIYRSGGQDSRGHGDRHDRDGDDRDGHGDGSYERHGPGADERHGRDGDGDGDRPGSGGRPRPRPRRVPEGVVLVVLSGIDVDEVRRDRSGPSALRTLELLEQIEQDFPDAEVSLNYVYVGSQSVMGGPATPVEPAAAPFPSWPMCGEKPFVGAGAGYNVGILDTGIIGAAGGPAHRLLAGRFVATGPSDEDVPADGPQPFLARQGGHGTFVAGLVRRTAPGARLLVHKVLRASGAGDLATLLLGIAEIRALSAAQQAPLHVLNLSLGTYTRHDRPPGLLQAALRRLGDTVVVAAAGNHNSWRPFWPAALPQVVAVGALDGSGRAPFSNYGPWVDACAVGVDLVSTFFDETAGPLAQVDLPPFPWSTAPVPARFPGFARWSGTSFAAPVVAGTIVAAATTWGVTPAQAADRLLRDWHRFRMPDLGVVLNSG